MPKKHEKKEFRAGRARLSATEIMEISYNFFFNRRINQIHANFPA